MKKRCYRSGLKDQFFEEACRLHEEGKGYHAIGKILGVYPSTVQYWIAKFAEQKNNCKQKAMNQTEENPKKLDMGELSNCSPEEQIAKLKEALRNAEIRAERAELKADLYEEMINVAEAKFKVAIKKKGSSGILCDRPF